MGDNNKIERNEISTPFDIMHQEPNRDIVNVDDIPLPPVEPKIDAPIESIEPVNDTPPIEPEAKEADDTPIDEVNTNEDEVKEDPPEEEYEVEVKTNLAKYTAEVLKTSGGLPEDFEVTDDLTEEDLNKAYRDYKLDTLKNEVVLDEQRRLAEEEGLTPAMIEEVKLRHYGVQDAQIQELNSLNYLATYEFKEDSETFDTDAEQFLTTYYTKKGLSKSRVEKFVANDISDEGLLSIISEAQVDLKNDYVTLDTNIKAAVAIERQKVLDNKNAIRNKTDELLSTGFIDNTQYSKEHLETVRRALRDKTEIITGPDGKKYKATLYYKKRLEASQDPEKDLAQKIRFILGSDSVSILNKERAKSTKKLMKGLNDFIDVKVKNKDPKPIAESQIRKESNIERRELGA